MKINKIFIFFVLLLSVVLFGLQYFVPPQFKWDSTYEHRDSNPFGCQLADSVFAASMPKGYMTKNISLEELADCSKTVNVLIVDDDVQYYETEFDKIDALTKRGAKVMIAAKEFSVLHLKGEVYTKVDESAPYIWSHGSFDFSELRGKIKRNDDAKATWAADGTYGKKTFKVQRQLLGMSDIMPGKDFPKKDVLFADNDSSEQRRVIAVRQKMNKGELILVSAPLLFTNYCMLDRASYGLSMRLMNLIADRPVVRIVADGDELAPAEIERQQSPLRALLRVPALAWGLYSALAVLLLFFISSVRRRQRAVPVVPPKKNRMLEFVRLVGLLSYRRKDYAGLVFRKWQLFAEELRRKTGVDISRSDDDSSVFDVLALHTGMKREELERTVGMIRDMLGSEEIGKDEMTEAVDAMNDILVRLD